MPARVQQHRGSAVAAELLLQQPETDRADPRPGADPERTGKTQFNGASEQLHVVERIRRTDAKTLLYRFTIEDPETWDRAWTGEYPWKATADQIYEYACHEGNYAMGGMLRGARQKEAEDAAKKQE